MRSTIYALSSGTGRSAIAVVRLSGEGVRDVLTALAGDVPPLRRAVVRRLADPATGEMLDEGLVLFFPGPRSYTGEDMAEFHVHGGRAVVAGVLSAIGARPGCRLAEPGEFTRRAMQNGRLDLTRVEGIADLIEAETALQRRQALGQAGGRLAEAVKGWRDALLDAMAELEADIDFADEDDVALHGERARVVDGLRRLEQQLGAALDDGRRGEILRDGFQVVIAGPPNAGKSTLLNRIAQRDVAIVTAAPGTTRDVLEVHLDLEGLPVTLVDTAGLREAQDEAESIGIARARDRAAGADLVLWLSPWDSPVPVPADLDGALAVTTKIDSAPKASEPGKGILLSARNGVGLETILAAIRDRAAGIVREPGLVSRARHREALAKGLDHLRAARTGLGQDAYPELVAEDLRLAARALSSVLGEVDVDHVLDRVFAGFCIGK
ncbi:MAG: tRNA uridine-5-carboxymethylaminomethyl(34) synthesis GTPase MnmE [Alsobacter sp.]